MVGPAPSDLASGVAPPHVFSFENHVLEPDGLADRAHAGKLTVAELLEGLPHFAATLALALQGLPQRLPGTFAAIEWIGFYIADDRPPRDLALGLGYNRVLPQTEVLE